jgi:hypothetical protein
MAIWYMLWPLGKFFGYLVYFMAIRHLPPFLVYFSRFGRFFIIQFISVLPLAIYSKHLNNLTKILILGLKRYLNWQRRRADYGVEEAGLSNSHSFQRFDLHP